MKKPSKKNIIILILVTIVLLVVAFISLKTGNNAVSNAVGTVISPVQKGATVAINTVKNLFVDVVNSNHNAKENEKLNETIHSLNSQIRMLEGHKTENDRLRALLEMKDNRKDVDFVGANVIGRDSSEFHNTITIDKGSKDGIKKNSVVAVPEGLVGVVFEVGVNFSKVRTIFDPRTAISAICLRSGDMGIVENTANLSSSGMCNMNYIDKSAKTVVGDMIETSGTGGVFPRGILIGEVKEIKEDSLNLTLSATIEASVNINNLDMVLVSR